MEAPRIKVLRL